MTNTALSAKAKQIAQNVTFRDDEHRKFFLTYLPKCRYGDVYHAVSRMDEIQIRTFEVAAELHLEEKGEKTGKNGYGEGIDKPCFLSGRL